MTDVRRPVGFDTGPATETQDVWAAADIGRGHLRLRTLVNVRWMVIVGEVMLMAAMGLGLGYQAPYGGCALVIATGALVNLATGLIWPKQRVLNDLEAVTHLSFDILQLSALLALIGGSVNPFVLVLLAPVTLAAATQPLRPLLLVGALGALCSILLAIWALPYPAVHPSPRLTIEFRLTAGVANVAGMALIAGYVRQSVVDAARMALALDVTRTVLAREQQLSALGALAAAAAHELGTPLATISIIAKELSREAPTTAVKADADLLIVQAERCREILRRLAATPDQASDEVHGRLSLRQLVQEVIAPHATTSADVRVEAIVTGAKGVKTPAIRRLPEITHAFTSLVENAVDFARSEILVSARFDADTITIEVRDDGRGFSAEILPKLGEPYVTSRPGAEGSRTGHVGMGLGFFISKTLLERTGAVVTYYNGKPQGAIVSARWKRSELEVA